MISVLRKIRSKLTGDVKKTGDYEYTVNDKILVKLNYHCNWTTSPRTCEPSTVSVKLAPDYLFDGMYSPQGLVFSTRTIQPRNDYSYNFESVLVAVTRGLERVDEWEKDFRANKAKSRKYVSVRNAAVKRLGKSLPKKGRKSFQSGFCFGDTGEIDVMVNVDRETHEVTYSISVEDISSMSDVKSILRLARKVITDDGTEV